MKMRRQGKYTKNIGAVGQARRSSKRHFKWFRDLSLKKKIAVVATPIILFLITVPLVTYALLARDISNQERLMNRNNTGIVIKDKNNQPIYSVGKAEHRDMVGLDQISKDVQHALIATEDKDFYKHGGFSVLSIIRSLASNIVARDANAYGGSTLTQQLAKNTLLSNEKSFLRKYQELAVAVAIEQNYSKDEILKMYLNSVYYGENAFGINEASKTYFNKKPSELTLPESAMLIGVLPAPSAYSPISGNKDYAKQRQNKVLSRMLAEGYITKEQKDQAVSTELVYGEGAKTASDSKAPHFTEMVIKELSDKYGYEKVMRSGYQVKTTLDLKIQEALTASITKQMSYVQRNGGSNAAGIAIDPKTGAILALVGSADWNNEQWGKVNIVTSKRQPGSSYKPIYYAGALADGKITPATILKDEPTDFGGGYKPQNADRRFRGDVTARSALSQSLNIPAIEVMKNYGVKNTVNMTNNLGISIAENKDYDLTLALGSVETRMDQMTNAYATFANAGSQHSNYSVDQINDKFDKRIFAAPNQKPRQVISAEGAYLISSILSDNKARAPIFGNSLTVTGKTAAVKTGTTNDNKDAWTIGYTPSLALGVWVGNNDNTPMVSGGSDMAGPIWRSTMGLALADKENETFNVPAGIVQRNVCSSNGGLASAAGPGVYSEYFKADALPANSCQPKVEPKISVCNLNTMSMEQIEEKDFDSLKYSKNAADCEKKKTVQVCDTQTGTIVALEPDLATGSRYSNNVDNCKKKASSEKIQVCDLTTKTIVSIDSSDFTGSQYSKDLTQCQTQNQTPTTPTNPPTNGGTTPTSPTSSVRSNNGGGQIKNP